MRRKKETVILIAMLLVVTAHLSAALAVITLAEDYEGRLWFESDVVEYNLGASDVISDQAASVEGGFYGDITYSIPDFSEAELAACGISIDSNNGKITMTSFDALCKALNMAGGNFELKVEAKAMMPEIIEKSEPESETYESDETAGSEEESQPETDVIYVEATAAYTVVIKPDTTAPEIDVTYSEPINIVSDGTSDPSALSLKNIYNGAALVTVNITELNFDKSLVSLNLYVLNSKSANDANGNLLNTAGAKNVNHDGSISGEYVKAEMPDISWNGSCATFSIPSDGAYYFTIDCEDMAGNSAARYDSSVGYGIIVIDTVPPQISVEYGNSSPVSVLADSKGHRREYYNSNHTAVITVTDQNFDSEGVKINITASDVCGNSLDVSLPSSDSEWICLNDGVYTFTIIYSEDANYTFDIECTDLAENESDNYDTDYFTVDKTSPENLSISYSTSLFDTIISGISFGFYNSPVTVTISAEDNISGVVGFTYGYMATGDSENSSGTVNGQTIETSEIKFSDGGKKAEATFKIPAFALSESSQFNGSIFFSVRDLSMNEASADDGANRIVVDSISPSVSVLLPEPVCVEETSDGCVNYYNENITAVIAVDEANFFPEDVSILIYKDDGDVYEPDVEWIEGKGSIHTGILKISGDGRYAAFINYTDRSDNKAQAYTSPYLVIDTEISDPFISVNGKETAGFLGAYENDALVKFSFEDENYAEYKVELSRARLWLSEDVTDMFVSVDENENGGSGSFNVPGGEANDGIYYLTLSVTDKAGNTASAGVSFTLNRYGSVYVYDDYLVSIISDGGQYLKIEDGNDAAVTKDLIITEYSAAPLLTDSAQVIITRDGSLIEPDINVMSLKEYFASLSEDGDVKEARNNPRKINESINDSWYSYVYSISRSNFTEDGVYKITLTSAYKTVDTGIGTSASVTGNSMDSAGNSIIDMMTFTVDTTPPEFRSISNLDEAIINAASVDVSYTVVDVGGLSRVEVYLNDDMIECITDFDSGIYIYNGTFTVNESSRPQTIRLAAADLAGNITDTSLPEFKSANAYDFNDKITVSKDPVVRWYSDKILFYGSIAILIILVAGIIIAVHLKCRSILKKLP